MSVDRNLGIVIMVLFILLFSSLSVLGAIPRDAADLERGIYRSPDGDVYIVYENTQSTEELAEQEATRIATETIKKLAPDVNGEVGRVWQRKVISGVNGAGTSSRTVRVVINLEGGYKSRVSDVIDQTKPGFSYLNPVGIQEALNLVQSSTPTTTEPVLSPADEPLTDDGSGSGSTPPAPSTTGLVQKPLKDLNFDRATNAQLDDEGVAGILNGKNGKYFRRDRQLYFVEEDELGSTGVPNDNIIRSKTRLLGNVLDDPENKFYANSNNVPSSTLPSVVTSPTAPGTATTRPVVVGDFGTSDILQDPINNEIFKTSGVPGRGPPDSVDYAGKEGRYFLSRGELYFVPNDDLPSVLTPEKRNQILPDLRQPFTHDGKNFLADSAGNIYNERGILIKNPEEQRKSANYRPAVTKAEQAKENSKYVLGAKDIANIGFYSGLGGRKVEVPITTKEGGRYLVDSDGNLFYQNNHLEITGDEKEAILVGYENAVAYDNAIAQARGAKVSLLSIDLSPIRTNIVFTGDSKSAGPYSVDAQGNIYNNNNGQRVSPEEFEKILENNPEAVDEAVQRAQKQEDKRRQRAASGILVSGESGADEIDTLLKAGVINHAEAARRYAEVAEQQQKLAEALINNNPSQNDIKNAPVGSTVVLDGKVLTKDSKGNYVSKDGKTIVDGDSPLLTGEGKVLKTPDAQKAEKEAQEAKAKQEQTEAKVSWAEGIFGEDFGGFLAGKTKATEYFRLGAVFSQRAGRYRGISNTLFPDATQKFVNAQSHEFFDTMTRLTTDSPLPAAICKRDDALRAKSPGQSSRTVRTISNTYQFVGSIQGEKSPVDGGANVPIRCSENLDPEADEDEMYICPQGLFCNDQVFCYSNPDEFTQPALGYYYKITWGVSAPSDERFTPYVDENNVSVKFNIQLRSQGGTEFLYKRLSDGLATTSHFQLAGGASDGQTIVFYSPKNYQDACILFDPTGPVIDRDDLDENGGFLGKGVVREICIGSFRQSTTQAARFASPDRAATSVTTQSGNTALNI